MELPVGYAGHLRHSPGKRDGQHTCLGAVRAFLPGGKTERCHPPIFAGLTDMNALASWPARQGSAAELAQDAAGLELGVGLRSVVHCHLFAEKPCCQQRSNSPLRTPSAESLRSTAVKAERETENQAVPPLTRSPARAT